MKWVWMEEEGVMSSASPLGSAGLPISPTKLAHGVSATPARSAITVPRVALVIRMGGRVDMDSPGYRLAG